MKAAHAMDVREPAQRVDPTPARHGEIGLSSVGEICRQMPEGSERMVNNRDYKMDIVRK